MKLVEVNNELRNNYKNTVIIMKYGNFYRCFYNNALIMNYIFNYKINETRIGFPISIINNVINTLDELNIGYLIYNKENDIKYNIHKDNNYEVYLEKAIEKNNRDNMIKELNDNIIYLLNKDISNYNKIKEYINGL